VTFIISFILICAGFVSAQSYSGTVLNASGNRVEGVFVSVGHTELYTRTDADGRFNIDASVSIGFTRPPQSKGQPITARWNFGRRTLDLGAAAGVTSVSIYTLNGRRVVNSKVPTSRIISLPSLPMGIYLLELSGDGGARSRGRVVLSNKNSSFTLRSMSSTGGSLLPVSESAMASSTGAHRLIFRHDKYFPVDTVLSGFQNGMFVFLTEDPRHVVFDQSKVHEYRFTISSADSLDMYWNGFKVNNGEPNRYKQAAMEYNGVSIGGVVGLRHKGSQYSLPRCFNFDERTGIAAGPRTCPKVSFKVKFTEYDSNKRFHAMKRINLHSMNADPTKMRDMLAYELYREVGIHAPRTSYANVYVNNTHIGLFIAVEDLDGRFTASRWPGSGRGDGNLYKEVWPDRFDERYYVNALSTNEDVPGVNARRMVDFYGAIASSNESNFVQNVSEFMDFDHFLRYMAVDVAINNWDGIRGWYSGANGQSAANHNFYIYEEEARNGGKIWLVPWDMDNTFWEVCPYFETARVPQWNETPAHCRGYMVWGDTDQYIRAPNCDPLTKMMAAVFWGRYKQFGEQFLNDQFQNSRMVAKINRHRQLIAPFVAADNAIQNTWSGYSWENEVNRKIGFMPNLAVKFSRHLSGAVTIPDLTPNPNSRFLSPLHLNDFELTSAGNPNGWIKSYFSANSTDSIITRNTSNPIGGGADLRFEFTFRSTDNPSPWDVWGNFQPEFAEPADFSRLREIRLDMRADRSRSIRIALGNYEVYQANQASSEYGWENISVTAQSQEVVLDMINIRYPSWAGADPNIRGEVLQSVKTLIFSLNGRYVNNDGVDLIDNDTGFLQVDNIRFIYNN